MKASQTSTAKLHPRSYAYLHTPEVRRKAALTRARRRAAKKFAEAMSRVSAADLIRATIEFDLGAFFVRQ